MAGFTPDFDATGKFLGATNDALSDYLGFEVDPLFTETAAAFIFSGATPTEAVEAGKQAVADQRSAQAPRDDGSFTAPSLALQGGQRALPWGWILGGGAVLAGVIYLGRRR